MAINKVMRATLKALTHLDHDVKKTYPVERQIKKNLGKWPDRNYEFNIWDRKVYCRDYNVPVRIFSGGVEENLPVLLFFHGGGWVTGNIDSYTRVCSVMAGVTGYTVVSVDYRLAPEYPFPYAVEDCYAVTKEILSGGILGAQPEQVTLIGDSAGGNLAAVVSLMARDRGDFVPRRQILIYPLTNNDHTETSPFPSVSENGTDYLLTAKRIRDLIDLYKMSDEDLKSPYFAPLLAEDLSRQPETLIITAEFDPLRDEGEYYGEQLRQAGNDVEIYRMADALHGFMSLPPSFPHVKKAYTIINTFLENRE